MTELRSSLSYVEYIVFIIHALVLHVVALLQGAVIGGRVRSGKTSE